MAVVIYHWVVGCMPEVLFLLGKALSVPFESELGWIPEKAWVH
jgi:hypothetical protein